MTEFKQGNTFKPMRAAATKNKELEEVLQFPAMMSPKIDGIRCVTMDHPDYPGVKLFSNSLKPIPNEYIQRMCISLPLGLDGELIAINDEAGKDYITCYDEFPAFNDVQSAVMSQEGRPSFTFIVFDMCHPTRANKPYAARIKEATKLVEVSLQAGIRYVSALAQTPAYSYGQFQALHEKYVREGFEGSMLRDLSGGYKWGRSTLKQAFLVKVKAGLEGTQIERYEAEILGFHERMHDPVAVKKRALTNMTHDEDQSIANEAKKALVAMHNQPKKALLEPLGTLGAFEVRDLVTGVTFCVGSGPLLTDEGRLYAWTHQEELKGKILSYECMIFGQKEAPRHPVAVGYRHELDIALPDD